MLFRSIFDEHVHGTVPIEWERYLDYAGLELVQKDSVIKPWIGVVTSDAGERTAVTRVVAGSPAHAAGLDIGDEIVALNGYRARTADLNERIGELKAGEKVRLTVFRDEQLREFEVTLEHPSVPAYKIVRTKLPSEMQRQILEQWLKASWSSIQEEGRASN